MVSLVAMPGVGGSVRSLVERVLVSRLLRSCKSAFSDGCCIWYTAAGLETSGEAHRGSRHCTCKHLRNDNENMTGFHLARLFYFRACMALAPPLGHYSYHHRVSPHVCSESQLPKVKFENLEVNCCTHEFALQTEELIYGSFFPSVMLDWYE